MCAVVDGADPPPAAGQSASSSVTFVRTRCRSASQAPAAVESVRTADGGLAVQARFVNQMVADAGPAGLRMQELEELALFTRGGLTRLVDRIEAAGLVRREPVPGDRRGVRVVLTTDGRERYTAAMARHREVIEREFGRRLTPAQHRSVADALWSWWHDADPAAFPAGEREPR